MDVGLNLFSIRNLIQKEKDFLDTAYKLKDMGYSYMQYSGGPYDAATIARVSRETNMPVYLTHVPMDRILNDTDKLMEEHASFSCKNIGLGMMPVKTILDNAEFEKTVSALNAAGEKMQKNGFSFFYHHHHYEFFKRNGETALEYMLKNAPYINFTFDTFWAQYGGADVLTMLDKMRGRISCVHLKDYQISLQESDYTLNPTFAAVGDGNMDFKKIVAKMKECGTKYFFVEQDDAALLPDPLSTVQRSIRYIKSVL